MNSSGWKEADFRELEKAGQFPTSIGIEAEKQFDEVFRSCYYEELDLSKLEKEADERWQNLIGGGK